MSNKGIEYWRRGDRLFLPPSEEGGEWRELAAQPQPTLRPVSAQAGIRSRRQRKPTLTSVSKQASRAGIEVARYEIKPDGTVVVVTGKSEATEPNPWLDDLKVTKQ